MTQTKKKDKKKQPKDLRVERLTEHMLSDQFFQNIGFYVFPPKNLQDVKNDKSFQNTKKNKSLD